MFRGFHLVFSWKILSSMTVTLEIELQVPPTPQLVKRGEDLIFTGPMEVLVVYKSW